MAAYAARRKAYAWGALPVLVRVARSMPLLKGLRWSSAQLRLGVCGACVGQQRDGTKGSFCLVVLT